MERYMLKHGSMDTYRSSEKNEKYSETVHLCMCNTQNRNSAVASCLSMGMSWNPLYLKEN